MPDLTFRMKKQPSSLRGSAPRLRLKLRIENADPGETIHTVAGLRWPDPD